MGSVYLIGDRDKEGVYKIGVTRGSVEKRMKKLQTGNSGEIYLVNHYEIEFPFMLEQMLHNRYSPNKVMNEWFSLSNEEVKNFIETCKEFEKIIELLKDNCFFKKKLEHGKL